VSARALYPSYVDLDPFIDVARLRALDSYVRERLERRIAAERDLAFYTGPFLLRGDAPTLPGARMVYLSRTGGPDNYYDLDRTELWAPAPDAEAFPEVIKFIATLPFAATGRMLIIYDESGRAVPAHRDHDEAELCTEFMWLRTSKAKPFYMLNPETGEQLYVAGHSAWFDTVNQFHGADASDGLSFSIRIDGRFTDDFRRQIPFPHRCRSAAPAHWAASLS
jgi:hypothetical protein